VDRSPRARGPQRWRRDAELLAAALHRQRQAFMRGSSRCWGFIEVRGSCDCIWALQIRRFRVGSTSITGRHNWHGPALGIAVCKRRSPGCVSVSCARTLLLPDEALAVMAISVACSRVMGRAHRGPDIEQCLRAYVRRDRRFFAARRAQWPWWPPTSTRLESFLGYAAWAQARMLSSAATSSATTTRPCGCCSDVRASGASSAARSCAAAIRRCASTRRALWPGEARPALLLAVRGGEALGGFSLRPHDHSENTSAATAVPTSRPSVVA